MEKRKKERKDRKRGREEIKKALFVLLVGAI